MDKAIALSKIYKEITYNPACFNFSEEEARAKKLWRDPRPMPTEEDLQAAWDSVKDEIEKKDNENKRQKELGDIYVFFEGLLEHFLELKSKGDKLNKELDNFLIKYEDAKLKHPKIKE